MRGTEKRSTFSRRFSLLQQTQKLSFPQSSYAELEQGPSYHTLKEDLSDSAGTKVSAVTIRRELDQN